MLKNLHTLGLFLCSLLLWGCESTRNLVDYLPSTTSSDTVEISSADLLVIPMVGASPTVGQELAKTMAWGLQEAGYPARTANTSDGVNPVLAGWIEKMNTGVDVVWVNFDWAMYDPTGQLVGTYRQEMAVSRLGWDNASSDTLGIIVTESVPHIHEMIEGKIPLREHQTIATSTLSGGNADTETIVVSSEGLSRLTDDGEQLIEQLPATITFDPAENEAPNTEVVSEVTLAAPTTLEPEPMMPSSEVMNAINQKDTPTGQIEGAILPSVTDIQQVPVDPTNAPLDPTLDEMTAEPDLLPEDVDIVTPEAAALVSTAPELTPSEPMVAKQPEETVSIASVEQISENEPNLLVEELQPTTDTVTPGVSGLPEYAVSVPQPPPVSLQEEIALTNGQPIFLVREAIGAPGDGNLALPIAMQQALRAADAAITNDPTVASHIIQCSVRVDTPFAGRQRTRIVWTVTDILGQETGRAVQENDVPQGSLEQSWVPIAPAIASAAVKGIRKLFINGITRQGIGGNLSQPDLPHVIAP